MVYQIELISQMVLRIREDTYVRYNCVITESMRITEY